MLQIARDCVGRETPNCFSLGNFCTFSGDLQQCREREASSPRTIHNEVTEKRLGKLSDTTMSVSEKCEVFLGGSCNPTTWRKDTAIPIFKRYGVSFYNPQVAHWDKSLIELEHNAKQQAKVMLFVFDRSTRNVASMAEAAYLAASRRKLVVVLDNYFGAGQLINGEAISQREYEELSSALKTLKDIVGRHSIPIYTHLRQAVTWIAKSLRDNSWPMKIDSRESYQTRRSQCQLLEKLIESSNAASSSKSFRITLEEACVVFKAVVGRDLSKIELQTIETAKNGLDGTSSVLCKKEILLNFDEFCCIISEFDSRKFDKKEIWQLLSHSVMFSIQKYVDWAIPMGHHSVKSSKTKDIYLGGSLGASCWRDNIAIPYIYKHGLTYRVPYSSPSATESKFSSSEATTMEECRVLLFFIDNSSRDISQIAIANYCIGLGLSVVLCVKMLSQDTTINEEQLSSYAIKDYNRGRNYLIDQANDKSVPVFHDISDALECAVEKCKIAR